MVAVQKIERWQVITLLPAEEARIPEEKRKIATEKQIVEAASLCSPPFVLVMAIHVFLATTHSSQFDGFHKAHTNNRYCAK